MIVKPYYKYHTDSIILYLENVKSYETYFNDEVSLFRACDNDRIVGVEIKGASRLIFKQQPDNSV